MTPISPLPSGGMPPRPGVRPVQAGTRPSQPGAKAGPRAGQGTTRRDFLKAGAMAGLVSAGGLGAFYFGYEKALAKPVRIGVIGTGDEGSVLIGALNPDFVEVKAIADVRPFSIYRASRPDRRGVPPRADAGLPVEQRGRGPAARQGLRPVEGPDRQRRARTGSRR